MTNEMDLQATTDLLTSQRTQRSSWSDRILVYYFALVFLGAPVALLVSPNSLWTAILAGLLLIFVAGPALMWRHRRRRLNVLRERQMQELRAPKDLDE